MPLVGVLGGMGPLATADFLRKWARATDASRDQDHPRFVAYSNPHTPDRSAAILAGGPSPLPHLIEGLRFLETAGVDAIVIPCNTAHYWLSEMQSAIGKPIISIFEGVTRALEQSGARRIGVLGTAGTLASGLYQSELGRRGFEIFTPPVSEIETIVEPCIRAVKAGDLALARSLISSAVNGLARRGAEAVVLGCTELPVAAEAGLDEVSIPVIDSSAALARFLADWIEAFVPDALGPALAARKAEATPALAGGTSLQCL